MIETKVTTSNRKRVFGDRIHFKWRHNWKECPKEIEIIELSTLLDDAEQIDTQLKTEKKLTAWQEFCQKKRLEGLSFGEIAKHWKARKEAGSGPGLRI